MERPPRPRCNLCWPAQLEHGPAAWWQTTAKEDQSCLCAYVQVLHGDLKSSNVVLNACHTCAKVSVLLPASSRRPHVRVVPAAEAVQRRAMRLRGP